MCNLKLWFTATRLKLVVSFRPFFWVYHVKSWHQRMTAKKTRQVLHLLEYSKIFLCTCIWWGLWMRNKTLSEEVLGLKFISVGRFSILGAQTITMVTEALMAQPKGFICTCALIFIVYFFVCFMQNTVELMLKLKVLWRTQTFSHEIHIKNHSLKYISRLEQTNNLISKLNKLRYWKKYQKFR